MNVGARLREIRTRRRLTIDELAGKTGLSRPYISQVETGKASPSLQTIEKLATALAVPVPSLFIHDSFACEVIRAGVRQIVWFEWPDRSPVNRKRVEVLSAPNRQIEMVFLEIPVGYTEGGFFHSHDGEECHWLVEGRLKAIHGEKTLIIEAGDSFHWDASIPHRVENIGDKPAKLLIARVPPGFLDVRFHEAGENQGLASE